MSAQTYVITVEEMPARNGVFVAYLGAREVCRSRTPFLTAARVLLGEGTDPATILIMRHAGSSTDAQRSTIRAVANLTVEDRQDGVPVFRRQRAPKDSGAASLVGANDEGVG